MNIRHCITGVLIGILLGTAMLLTVTVSITKRADTEVTPEPPIVLMIAGARPNSLDLVWTDRAAPVEHELFDDATGMAIESFGLGISAGTIDNLTCGVAYRFWLVSADGRSSNTIVGITGPCSEAGQRMEEGD